MFFDSLDFSNNDYRKLLFLLKSSKVCFFIGSGFSNYIKDYPTWDKLTEILCEKLNYKYENCKEIDNRRLLDILKNQDEEKFLNYFEEIFLEKEKSEFCESRKVKVFEYIDSLLKVSNKNIIVTTNWDREIEKNLKINNSDIAIYPNLTIPPKKYTYLHGRLEVRDSYVMTFVDYVEANDRDIYKKFVKYLSENYCVVFIGYSLKEDIISLNFTNYNRNNHYFVKAVNIDKKSSLEIEAESLYRAHNIITFAYKIELGIEFIFEKLYEDYLKYGGFE